jgi:hypothetical protein
MSSPSSDGAALGAWWGGHPSYRRRSLRPLDPLCCSSAASALSPATAAANDARQSAMATNDAGRAPAGPFVVS